MGKKRIGKTFLDKFGNLVDFEAAESMMKDALRLNRVDLHTLGGKGALQYLSQATSDPSEIQRAIVNKVLLELENFQELINALGFLEANSLKLMLSRKMDYAWNSTDQHIVLHQLSALGEKYRPLSQAIKLRTSIEFANKIQEKVEYFEQNTSGDDVSIVVSENPPECGGLVGQTAFSNTYLTERSSSNRSHHIFSIVPKFEMDSFPICDYTFNLLEELGDKNLYFIPFQDLSNDQIQKLVEMVTSTREANCKIPRSTLLQLKSHFQNDPQILRAIDFRCSPEFGQKLSEYLRFIELRIGEELKIVFNEEELDENRIIAKIYKKFGTIYKLQYQPNSGCPSNIGSRWVFVPDYSKEFANIK